MAQDVLVEARFDDGRRLIQAMQRGGVNVVVAGWTVSRERIWTLYIAAADLEPHGWREAYRVLNISYIQLIEATPAEPTFGLSEISLVRDADVVTAELTAIRDRSPRRAGRRRPIPSFNRQIDGRLVRRVYVYPPFEGMTTRDVIHAVAESVAGGPNKAPSEVELSNGRKLAVVPLGVEQDYATGRVSVKLFDPATRQAESYPLAEITAIR